MAVSSLWIAAPFRIGRSFFIVVAGASPFPVSGLTANAPSATAMLSSCRSTRKGAATVSGASGRAGWLGSTAASPCVCRSEIQRRIIGVDSATNGRCPNAGRM